MTTTIGTHLASTGTSIAKQDVSKPCITKPEMNCTHQETKGEITVPASPLADRSQLEACMFDIPRKTGAHSKPKNAARFLLQIQAFKLANACSDFTFKNWCNLFHSSVEASRVVSMKGASPLETNHTTCHGAFSKFVDKPPVFDRNLWLLLAP